MQDSRKNESRANCAYGNIEIRGEDFDTMCQVNSGTCLACEAPWHGMMKFLSNEN